ncbi:hypothetical protein JCM19000A_06240 [Silvimonas sp. JCM 19000]
MAELRFMNNKYTHDEIWHAAMARIAGLFAVEVGVLDRTDRFGENLVATSSSDFKRNEFDILSDDIRDVSDKADLKRLGSGDLLIFTVADYCSHMVRCYARNPEEVCHTLGLRLRRA